MTKCKHWGSGWCYAPVDVKTNAIGKFGVCKLPEYCPYLKSQNKMTDMFISIDGEATLGTKCPTHKLEIKKMTEIQQTEGEIKVLQAKLELLKEMEKHKSPIEKAFYRVYGCYPPTTPSVSNSEDERWSDFQKGYNASKEECKVEEEPKPMDDVINRLLEKYESQKLWNMVRNELGYSINCCDEIVDLVERWIPEEQNASGSQNVDTELLVDGFNDAIRKMKEMLR